VAVGTRSQSKETLPCTLDTATDTELEEDKEDKDELDTGERIRFRRPLIHCTMVSTILKL